MRELIEICEEACAYLAREPVSGSVPKRLKKDDTLRGLARTIQMQLKNCGEVYAPSNSADKAPEELTAVTWNIERGKRLSSIARTLQTHPALKNADLYFLTEVDWGMARSGNANVAAELGKALNLHAYFAPSYFNFTQGHGSERHLEGANSLGLHGKAILSRYPLKNLASISMPNAINKLKSKEARLGEKRALRGNIKVSGRDIDVACIHLDAFSSPKMRALQMRSALQDNRENLPALLAGDWNTNTLNSTSGRTIFLTVMRQLILTGPQKMIVQHHPYPEKKFDRRLFRTLTQLGFDYDSFNEMGVGTYDVVNNDMELGQMANDQFPLWILKWINRLVEKSGGLLTMKLDWFAGRGLEPLEKKVIRLKSGVDYPPDDRPSDHHPVLLKACLPASS